MSSVNNFLIISGYTAVIYSISSIFAIKYAGINPVKKVSDAAECV